MTLNDYMRKYSLKMETETERRIIMYEYMMIQSARLGDCKNYVQYLDFYLHYRHRANL